MKIEDPYSTEAGGWKLQDFLNEYLTLLRGIRSGWTDEQVVQRLKDHPVRTVHVMYTNDEFMRQAIIDHPVKVECIDRMVGLANACTSVTRMKPILNEIGRLIYGKRQELHFPEPEFNPDLVSLK